MSSIKQATLKSVVSVIILFGGCKAKESLPAEPNAQSTGEQQNTSEQEQLAGSPALALSLRYMGRPIEEFTSTEPLFSFNNKDTHEKGMRPDVKHQKGHYVVRDIAPGNYVIFVSIDANPDNPGGYPGYPGDFFYQDSRLFITADDETRLNIDLQKVIHLVLPQDNAGVMEKWGEKGQNIIDFTAPVEFVWDALADGMLYEFSIYHMQSEPHRYLERDVVKEATQATHVSLDLAPSADNEFYSFRLRAKKGSIITGDLVTHGPNGYAIGFYRFRIK